MTGKRSYEGPALDGTVQYITERPELDEDDDALEGEDKLVYATEPEPEGRETTENVPIPTSPPKPVDEDGQTSLEDWTRRSLP